MTSTATITAFLYAGALQAPATDNTYPFDDWGGHTGFVSRAELYAKAINKFLQEQSPDHIYPGVLEYEVIEPMGMWLIANHEGPPSVERAMAEFREEYAAFVARGALESDL